MRIPTRPHEQRAGLSKGDVVEFSFERGRIGLTPRAVIDYSELPTADGDYTPAQRRQIDARLAESEPDFKAVRTHGPFNNADEAIAFVRKRLGRSGAKPEKLR